jgi:two-component system, chemotaxis family, response regulator Rcp1
MRILLVEDSEGDVFLVRRALDKQGLKHELIVARNGEEALHMLEQAEKGPIADTPEIVLLDLNLPKVHGSQILSHIRRTQAFDGMRVIILTSSDSPSDRELALALGANVYFRKPTDLQSFMELGQVVKQLLATR